VTNFDSEDRSDGSVEPGAASPNGEARPLFPTQAVSAEQGEGAAAMHPPAEGGAPGSAPFALRWVDLAIVLGFYLFTAVMLSAGLALLGIGLEPQRRLTTNQVALVAVGQALHSAALLAFLYLMVRSRSAAAFWPALGWHALPGASRGAMVVRYLLTGAAVLVMVQVASSYMGTEPNAPMEALFQDRSSVLMMMALAILVAPLVEETLFRGCIYPVLARAFGVPAGVVFTGALFGLFHALQLGFEWKPVVLLMMVGIIFTYVRARTGTVLASYFVHFGYNSFLFGAFYFATGGLRNFPGS
jgi:membrane protease YdiL (CAAX protease family)